MVASQSSKQKEQHGGSAWIHVVSWAIMIAMTVFAFLAVGLKLMSMSVVVPVIVFLMFIQVVMQLYIFMHLNTKSQAFQMLFMMTGLAFGVIFSVGIWWMR